MKLSVIIAIYFSFFILPRLYAQLVQTCDQGVFQEKDGMVVFEAESIFLSDGWSMENNLDNFSGDGYITWTNDTILETNGQGLLAYVFNITKPGLYTLKMRNYHSCDDFTECNDIYVKMNDSEWRKNFNHTVGEWDWNTQQDIDHVFSNSTYFLEKGEHTLYLSGRSKDFSIDKIAIFHNKTPQNLYKSVKTSKCSIDSNLEKY